MFGYPICLNWIPHAGIRHRTKISPGHVSHQEVLYTAGVLQFPYCRFAAANCLGAQGCTGKHANDCKLQLRLIRQSIHLEIPLVASTGMGLH